MEFFEINNINLYVAIALSIINGILLLFVGYKFLQILQLSNYKLKGYFLWLKDTKGRYISRILMLTLLSTACMLVTNYLLDTSNVNSLWSYLGLVFYFYFTSVFIQNLYNAPRKTPLKLTNRMNRLRWGIFILMAIITFALIALVTILLPAYRFAVVALTPTFLILVIPFINMILTPFEKANAVRYMLTAKRKLKKMPKLIKIGITGSVGKTSTKFILNTILSEKYSVCMSPFSYNTPMGITKSIIQYLDFSHQVLITEMGARFKGDIKELCKLVEPHYGILTNVSSQHLQTFGNFENIKNTKYELVECIGENGGLVVFNGACKAVKELYDKATIDKIIVNSNDKNDFACAKDIDYSKNGATFVLAVKNVGEIQCSTRLLGKHNIENIISAVAIAVKLNLTLQQIQSGINKIQPIEHRLQLINTDNGISILDDSYNGSVEGAIVAIETLKMFEGQKIIVTPGLVELGSIEKQENIELGKKIANVADKVIIVNVAHSLDIKEGLLSQNFNESNIIQVDSLTSAQNILTKIMEKDACVLFYNDLPDNYM